MKRPHIPSIIVWVPLLQLFTLFLTEFSRIWFLVPVLLGIGATWLGASSFFKEKPLDTPGKRLQDYPSVKNILVIFRSIVFFFSIPALFVLDKAGYLPRRFSIIPVIIIAIYVIFAVTSLGTVLWRQGKAIFNNTASLRQVLKFFLLNTLALWLLTLVFHLFLRLPHGLIGHDGVPAGFERFLVPFAYFRVITFTLFVVLNLALAGKVLSRKDSRDRLALTFSIGGLGIVLILVLVVYAPSLFTGEGLNNPGDILVRVGFNLFAVPLIVILGPVLLIALVFSCAGAVSALITKKAATIKRVISLILSTAAIFLSLRMFSLPWPVGEPSVEAFLEVAERTHHSEVFYACFGETVLYGSVTVTPALKRYVRGGKSFHYNYLLEKVLEWFNAVEAVDILADLWLNHHRWEVADLLARLDRDRAVTCFIKQFKEKKFESKHFHLLRYTRSLKLLPYLLEYLDNILADPLRESYVNPYEPILEVLEDYRTAEVMAALVTRMEKHEGRNWKEAVGYTLKRMARLYGDDVPKNAGEWRRWWEENKGDYWKSNEDR